MTEVVLHGTIRLDNKIRISSRAVRVFPALSLRHVRSSYGTFSLMVFQGNCAQGCTGHMIIKFVMHLKWYLFQGGGF